MITHHGIGGDIDSKDLAKEIQALQEPGFAVIEIPALFINAKEKRTPDATRDAVIVGCGFE